MMAALIHGARMQPHKKESASPNKVDNTLTMLSDQKSLFTDPGDLMRSAFIELRVADVRHKRDERSAWVPRLGYGLKLQHGLGRYLPGAMWSDRFGPKAKMTGIRKEDLDETISYTAAPTPAAPPEATAAATTAESTTGVVETSGLAWVEDRLRNAIPIEHVEILDVTDGHTVVGFNDGSGRALVPNGLELQLTVVSPAFVGKKTLDRHRMIYKSLRTELESGAVHSLPRVKAWTPDQWQEKVAQQNLQRDVI